VNLDRALRRRTGRFPLLTAREAQCAAGVICGLTADEIALKLDIKTASVITHRKRAYGRLGVSRHFDLLSLYHATARFSYCGKKQWRLSRRTAVWSAPRRIPPVCRL
jgi:DNA-binding CsgD family transcriptional regulator